MGDHEWELVRDVLQSGWITQGPMVGQFEEAVASFVGAEFGVAVCNGTAAIHLALEALDIGSGDEVIVPSLTFIATANAIRHCGATPVFADVERETFNLKLKSVEAVLSKRTKAILAVHQFGMPADLDRLNKLASPRGVHVVEDAACALGSRYHGRRIGSDAPLACFSFHPRKIITTGEGGLITTNQAALADRLRRLRHHGMDVTDWQRHQQPDPPLEQFVEVGYNYRMSDLSAAVGLAQMERIESLLDSRKRLGERYDSIFGGHPALRFPVISNTCETNYQTYALCLTEEASCDRDGLIRELRARGIAARTGLACIHQARCYFEDYGDVKLPNSEWLANHMFLLPLFPDMTGSQQDYVIAAVLRCVGGESRSSTQQSATTRGACGS
mgnify:CR=1 FL=1